MRRVTKPSIAYIATQVCFPMSLSEQLLTFRIGSLLTDVSTGLLAHWSGYRFREVLQQYLWAFRWCRWEGRSRAASYLVEPVRFRASHCHSYCWKETPAKSFQPTRMWNVYLRRTVRWPESERKGSRTSRWLSGVPRKHRHILYRRALITRGPLRFLVQSLAAFTLIYPISLRLPNLRESEHAVINY